MLLDKQGRMMGISQDEWKRRFSKRLITVMNEKKVSQAELARRSGLSDSRISDYIKTKSAPTIFAAVNLAEALNMKVADLICCDEYVHK